MFQFLQMKICHKASLQVTLHKKDDNALPLKPYLINNVEDIVFFLGLKVINLNIFYMFF